MTHFGLDALDRFFRDSPYFLTRHHLDSYNDFINKRIALVIQSMNPIVVLKADKADPNIVLHKIEMYIGNENGTELYFDKPLIVDPSTNSKRPLFPNEARLFNHTYSSDLYANVLLRITYKGSEVVEEVLKDVRIGSIPIMLHSKLCALNGVDRDTLLEVGECPYEQGGYFIVDGKEKVVVAQERPITNAIFVNKSGDPKYSYQGLLRCTSEKTSVFPKSLYFKVLSGEIAKGVRKNAIIVHVPHIDIDVPLCLLFRVLGVESDLEILQHVINKPYNTWEDVDYQIADFLHASIVDGNMFFDQQTCAEYLSQYVKYKSIENLYYVILNNLFPNLESSSHEVKAIYMGYVVKTLVKTCLGLIPETDRDNYMYKRIGISGFMMADIFKDFYNKFRVECRNSIDRLYEYNQWNLQANVKDVLTNYIKSSKELFNASVIAGGLSKSLKGSWGLDGKQGIVQDLNRISYQGFVSHLRRVNTPIDPSIKIRRPHQLNASHYGIVCPAESPDGGSIGLLKNFAMMCHISFDVASDVILQALKPFDIDLMGSFKAIDIGHQVQICVNHNWVGMAAQSDAAKIVEWIKLLRRNGCINAFISVAWNIPQRRINILTDSGRCMRPLLVVDQTSGQLLIESKAPAWLKKASWFDLIYGTLDIDTHDLYNTHYTNPFEVLGMTSENVQEAIVKLRKTSGVIEFVDVEEANTIYIAMRPEVLVAGNHYTHCELHPSTMFSVYTLSIPFANHNPPTRIVFSGAQGKQALGMYATNFNNRIDTMSYVLHYPQKPLVKTRFCDYVYGTDMPNGENLIVAIATYTGYNQEDSIIVNKRSIERGMFNLTYYKCHSESETAENKGVKVVFANKNVLLAQGIAVKTKMARYDKLDERGLPMEGAFIHEDDAIIGKFSVTKSAGRIDEKTGLEEDVSLVYSDKTVVADKTVEGLVDKVVVFRNKEGVREVKIRLRKFRRPELGDKMASRMGQKGVCGMIMPAENVPFTSGGLVPDIIINPHAFPSRMTIGQLMECVCAKGCALKGEEYDAIPFEDHNMDYWANVLEKHGLHKHGEELMCNGFNGQMMYSSIFIGPTFYFRLKHMVADKINYRTEGRVMGLTKQPTKGRSNQGGLRLGEMETNCLLSHGISSFMKESFIERSDKYEFRVDKDTGDISKETKFTPRIMSPYAFKLLLQEIQTMSIVPRLVTDEDDMDEEADEEAIDEARDIVLEETDVSENEMSDEEK